VQECGDVLLARGAWREPPGAAVSGLSEVTLGFESQTDGLNRGVGVGRKIGRELANRRVPTVPEPFKNSALQ
jgi:hypothetical protein